MSASEELDPEAGEIHDRIFASLKRLEKQNVALRSDFEGLYQAFLQLQNDVHFFSRRCEERGNLIREFAAQLRENGNQVDATEALDFLGQLECAGTPIRPPTGGSHPAVESTARSEFDEETEPGLK